MNEFEWTFSYFSEYAKIALENYTTIERLLKKRKVIDEKFERLGKISEDEDSQWGEINLDINKHCRIIIVFCALSLEAFINDYAASYLSKSYLTKYLDKLDLCAKWIVIPRLLTGSQLDTGAQPIQDLDWLIKERNTLVHNKPKTVVASEVSDTLNHYNEQAAQKAIQTVKNIALSLHNIDKRAHETWLYYEEEWFPSKRLNLP